MHHATILVKPIWYKKEKMGRWEVSEWIGCIKTEKLQRATMIATCKNVRSEFTQRWQWVLGNDNDDDVELDNDDGGGSGGDGNLTTTYGDNVMVVAMMKMMMTDDDDDNNDQT